MDDVLDRIGGRDAKCGAKRCSPAAGRSGAKSSPVRGYPKLATAAEDFPAGVDLGDHLGRGGLQDGRGGRTNVSRRASLLELLGLSRD